MRSSIDGVETGGGFQDGWIESTVVPAVGGGYWERLTYQLRVR